LANLKRCFDEKQKEVLGKYIYALRDPRDNKIFYVGQGDNDRIFDHFKEADDYLKKNKRKKSKKIERILEIWENESEVDWFIISHNLINDQNISDVVESAVYNSLNESYNEKLLNDNITPHSTFLTQEKLIELAAEFVNPNIPIKNVFIFPIQDALKKGDSEYDATRGNWIINFDNQNLKPSYAVGLKNAISKGSFEIDKWVNVVNSNK